MIEFPALPPDATTSPSFLVGFSGGLDSTVLLHALHARWPGQVRALHVHHGLHAEADTWETHCSAICAALCIPLDVAHVTVNPAAKLGLEGAAREARHAAFRTAMQPGEILALAHHRNDQAETVLLRALRGSGVDGLAAMRPWRRFEPGWLWRPLLDHPRESLLNHAQAYGLRWIEDPSNTGTEPDRNFLRLRAIPVLRERWPQADAALGRMAALQREASELAAVAAHLALQQCQRPDGDLRVDGLANVPLALRPFVLREWIARGGLPPLPARGVAVVLDTLLEARRDAQPRFAWRDAEVRRWRNRLHAQRRRAPLPADFSVHWNGQAPLQLPTGGSWTLATATGGGAAAFDQPLHVSARQGGERITLPGRGHSHALKHVLQDHDIAPWLREGLPLLWRDDGLLLAAGPIHSAALSTWLEQRSATLHWQPD